MESIITISIIVVTILISLYGFNNQRFLYSSLFNPYEVYHHKKYYRLISHGFIHGGWGHLFFNMITLFFFGRIVELYFEDLFSASRVVFILFYLSALIVSSIPDLIKHKDHPEYNALGASGAVSAVLFASILFIPKMGIYIYFIPIPIPAFIFAPLYLIYCQWMAKRGSDNIGHSAHFWGAIYGIVFILVLRPYILEHFLISLGLK